MIRHEQHQNQHQTLDYSFKDDENEANLVKFLHYLAGCRQSSCVRVDNAQTCISLLHVS